MFTGIVECTGVVRAIDPSPTGKRLRIEVGPMAGEVASGASVAVGGVCLTVSETADKTLEFDVIAETLSKSTLGSKRPGERLNLERSLRVGDRLDGHFLQGHVDGTARVDRIQPSASNWVVWFQPQKHLLPYVIPKGSIAIDGVSLTLAEIRDETFSVALIPTTLERTTLAALRVGDQVNIETDMIVRTIVHRLEDMIRAEGLTLDRLRQAGFA